MNIENNKSCFVRLWLRLERTRRLLWVQHKRYCIRNVLKAWFGHEANDEFIWKVCHQAIVDDEPQVGWDELPAPMLYPRRHRELLRAIVSVKTGIGFYRVNLKALDSAYSIAFPGSTPINVNKKASPLTLNPVVNGDSLPFVGPKPHSVASLKTPVAPRRGELGGHSLRGEGNLGRVPFINSLTF